MDEPTVGRIVHYVAFGTPGGEYPAGVCRAAIVTQVVDSVHVGLAVLNPTGMFFHTEVEYYEPQAGLARPGTWHWPERA